MHTAQPFFYATMTRCYRSYEGMGTALVQCKAGCQCKPTTLDGTWGQRGTVTQLAQLYVSQHPRCRLRVTVSKEPGQHPDPQGRRKVTLVAVRVTHITPEDMPRAGTLQWVLVDDQDSN